MKYWCKVPSRGTGTKEIADKNSIKSQHVGNFLHMDPGLSKPSISPAPHSEVFVVVPSLPVPPSSVCRVLWSVARSQVAGKAAK